MDRAGPALVCLLSEVSLDFASFRFVSLALKEEKNQSGRSGFAVVQGVVPLRWVNFKISVSKEKSPYQRRSISFSATIKALNPRSPTSWTV